MGIVADVDIIAFGDERACKEDIDEDVDRVELISGTFQPFRNNN